VSKKRNYINDTIARSLEARDEVLLSARTVDAAWSS